MRFGQIPGQLSTAGIVIEFYQLLHLILMDGQIESHEVESASRPLSGGDRAKALEKL